MYEGSGSPKSKMISGTNSSSKDLLHSKKVWEPMDSQMYSRSNSDSITRPSGMKVEEIGPNKKFTSSLCFGDFDDKSEDNNQDYNLKESENGHVMKDPCYSKEATQEELELFPIRNSSSQFPNMSSSSTSDNCSLSSSNTGNLESLTSDSEDASQLSEVRENSVCVESDFSKCHGLETETGQKTNGGENCVTGASFRFPLDAAESNPYLNPPTNTVQHLENATRLSSMVVQHQGMPSSVHNQNLHYPLFQAPSMSYYHQNPGSWAGTTVNGLISFTQPNPFLYTGTFGYGLNGNSHFVQYGAIAPHNVAAPIFYPGRVPVYQPVANGSTLNLEEHPQVCKPAASHGVPYKSEAVSKEAGRNDNIKSHAGNAGFSLFHFGGPVALSTGLKSNDTDIVGDISAKLSGVYGKGDYDCNKQETAIEEYNLFATSNSIRFSIF